MGKPELLEQLETYCAEDVIPMHMPGHKRNNLLAPYLKTLRADLDITEIPGFSNLHDPNGALAERMKAAAALWGSRRAWWLVGGSTAGILSGMFAAVQPGDQVILSRNCHRSVYNAALLRGVEVEYLLPSLWPGQSFCGPVTPEQVETVFARFPAAKLLVLTSPTYEGIISDIPHISEIAHRHGAAVLVDEAHGAHLGLSPAFGPSAVTQGADLVVQSLHKTLPSLTQTGLLHLCTDRVSPAGVGYWLSVFQTSSPSYLLMASIDSCVALLQKEGPALLEKWKHNLDAFHTCVSQLRNLSLPLAGQSGTDASKLVVSTRGTDLTGPELAERLRSQFQIEVEMATPDYVIAMTGLGDTWETLDRLADALLAIDRTISPEDVRFLPGLELPRRACSMEHALASDGAILPIDQAAGKVAGDFLWIYPPGIPLITPGEIISADLITYTSTCREMGVIPQTATDTPDGYLRVKNS